MNNRVLGLENVSIIDNVDGWCAAFDEKVDRAEQSKDKGFISVTLISKSLEN